MIEIRSYRRVFDLERRIYRIDRFRLNPAGIPVRGFVYLVAALASVAVLARAPGLGWLLARIPWYAAYVAFPVATSALLAVIQLEGRAFHLAALPLLGVRRGPRLSPRAPCRASWQPPELISLADGSDARLRALRYRGPGLVVIAVPHERAVRRSLTRGGLRGGRGGGTVLVLRPSSDAGPLRDGKVIALAASARLRVHADRSSPALNLRRGS